MEISSNPFLNEFVKLVNRWQMPRKVSTWKLFFLYRLPSRQTIALHFKGEIYYLTFVPWSRQKKYYFPTKTAESNLCKHKSRWYYKWVMFCGVFWPIFIKCAMLTKCKRKFSILMLLNQHRATSSNINHFKMYKYMHREREREKERAKI